MAGTVIPGELPTIHRDQLASTDFSSKLINTQDVTKRTSSIASLDSPRLTGDINVPNPNVNDYSSRIATTKFVQDRIGDVVLPPSAPTVTGFPSTVEAGVSYNFKMCCSIDMFGAPVDYYQIQHTSPMVFSKDTNILENESISMSVPPNSDNITYQITFVGVRGTKVSDPVTLFVTVVSIPTIVGQQFGGGTYAGRFMFDGKKYALIVSPKAEGTFTFQDHYSAMPYIGYLNTIYTNQSSDIDGVANTTILKNNIATQPLTDWLDQISTNGINGKRDWYIPSANELEICYRAFKPTNNQNIPTSSSVIVNNNDVFKDFNFPRGLNSNSIPNTAPYTLTDPKLTKTVEFEALGSESMYGCFYSSTFANTTSTNGIINDLWLSVQFFDTLNTTSSAPFYGPINASSQLYCARWLAGEFYGWNNSIPYQSHVRLVRRILLDT